MNKPYFAGLFLLIFTVFLTAADAQAQGADQMITTHCDASISAEDCAMAQEVASRLASGIVLEHSLHTWPPDLFVHDEKDENGNSVLNAFAHACGGDADAGMPHDCTAPEDSPKPHVHFTKMLLDEVVQGDADRMALIMGHEMAHIIQGHTTPYAHQYKGSSEVSLFAFGRQQEISSDVSGLQNALASGYDFDGMMDAFYRFIELDMSYSAFDGLGASHPSWEERLSFIDEDRTLLWRSMMAFRTGVTLLAAEQYSVATELFRSVIAAFPDSYEAQANLGYSQLMEYLDQLEPADMASFGLGQVVAGAFTRRPLSMEPEVRGVNSALWFQATTALQSALRINPEMTEAHANLGIAYLMQPGGGGAASAVASLSQAADLARWDYTLNVRSKAAIFINFSAAQIAQGAYSDAYDNVIAAQTELSKLDGFYLGNDEVVVGELKAALFYNSAMILSTQTDAESLTSSADYFDTYLSSATPSSNWWTLGYNRYLEVCEKIGRTPNEVAHYKSNHTPTYRTLSGLRFPNGVQVTLGQNTLEFLNEMEVAGGDAADYLPSNVVEETNLYDYVFYLAGTSVLATQEVIGVTLYDESAPALEIQETGMSADTKQIYYGMPVQELDAILGTDYEKRLLIEWGSGYRFFRDIGLAVRIENAVVAEIVVTQIPYQLYWEPETE